MKKAIALSIYMFAMVTGIATYANDDASINLGGKKAEITLTLNNVKEGQVLSIKDAYGSVLYNSTISTSGLYNNTFNLEALPNGDYSFEHEKGYEIKIIPFTVAQGEVTYDEGNEKSVFKPAIQLKENSIYLTQLDLDKNDVKVNIYYTSQFDHVQDGLIYSENITDTTNIKRIYSLSEKQKGNYKVVVLIDGRNYVENFKI